MTGTIRFPHLNISLLHVPKSLSFGGLEVACYGIVLAAAMVTGVYVAMKVAKATGQKEDDYFDLGIIGIIAAVVGARIYYVVFSWDYYSSHLSEIFNLRKGGLAIYGGVAGGCLAAVLFSRVRKLNIPQVLDTACIGLVWGQIVGRWGNFFNREAFGDYTDNLFAMQLPLEDVKAADVTETMRAHLQTIDGVEYIQVHPTFFYESLWNLGVLAVLLFLTFRVKRRKPGVIVLTYLLLYGAGRFWIEGLRTDQLILFGTGLPVSQVLSAVLVAVSLILLIFTARSGGQDKGKKGTMKEEQEGNTEKTVR